MKLHQEFTGRNGIFTQNFGYIRCPVIVVVVWSLSAVRVLTRALSKVGPHYWQYFIFLSTLFLQIYDPKYFFRSSLLMLFFSDRHKLWSSFSSANDEFRLPNRGVPFSAIEIVDTDTIEWIFLRLSSRSFLGGWSYNLEKSPGHLAEFGRAMYPHTWNMKW